MYVTEMAMVVIMKPPKQANKYIGRVHDQLIITVQQRMSKAKIRWGGGGGGGRERDLLVKKLVGQRKD